MIWLLLADDVSDYVVKMNEKKVKVAR